MKKSDHLLTGNNLTINLDMLYDISGDDEEYIKKMIVTFLKNMPDTLKKIEQGINEKNWDTVFKGAHYAKSSLSVIKVEEMAQDMLRIELNAKHKTDLSIIPPLYATVTEQFETAKKLLIQKFDLNL